ncbi:MAG: PEP-CTERM sorting domain-containing protein [Planctomycetaceae bacterium]|nr:PEP-CTERM sorting domain-containing protein [Planctomycetaceae bacterium]
MKKTLVSFTISFACLIVFCTFANADMLPSWKITTENTSDWQVANLLQINASVVNANNSEITETVFKNYLEGYSTVANPDKTLSKGAVLLYKNVKATEGLDGYITPGDAQIGFTYDLDGTPHLVDRIYSPGYSVFQTEFSLSSEISDLSGLFLNIDIGITIDDVLEGIFLNGYEITKYSSLKAIYGFNTDRSEKDINFDGSILLDDLIAQGLFLTDAANTLEFVVRNTGEIGNPYKISLLGDISISGERDFEHSFNPTPEPATLLICLTCGGLALAIRRRKNKKIVEM